MQRLEGNLENFSEYASKVKPASGAMFCGDTQVQEAKWQWKRWESDPKVAISNLLRYSTIRKTLRIGRVEQS